MRLDLDLKGILKVTATEKATGLARHVVIDNMMERFRQRHRVDALERIDSLFGAAPSEFPLETIEAEVSQTEVVVVDTELRQAIGEPESLIEKSERLQDVATTEDASELAAMIKDLRAAIERGEVEAIRHITAEVEDLVF